MKTQPLGTTDLQTTRLAYGCMRIAGTWDPREVTPERRAAGKAAIRTAVDAGYTLFDHADIYAQGESERIFGEFLRENPGVRNGLLIATKCGIRFPWGGDPGPHRYDFSREHILCSCEGSLARLGVETIDLYQLHRPDLLMDPEEIAGAFTELHRAGKVRHFGVSNFSPSFVTALQSGLSFPIVVNQVEIHLGRLDPFTDGTLDQCIAEKITPLAWSPLGGGFLGAGRELPENHPRRETMQALIETMDEVGGRIGESRTVVALAWLLKHPSMIVPIVGSANPENIRDAARADDVELSREDWYRLLTAARGAPLP